MTAAPARPAGAAAACQAWMGAGLCASAPDPDLWFPEVGKSAQPAVAACARCPVISQCLGYALSLPANPAGVWGGTTERERRDLREGPEVSRRRALADAAYRARPEVRERRRMREAARRRRLREAAAVERQARAGEGAA